MALSAFADKNGAAKTVYVSHADQRKAEYIYTEALVHRDKENYDAYHDLLQYAHDIDPGNTAVSYYLGLRKVKMGLSTSDSAMVKLGLALMKKHFDAKPSDIYEAIFYSDANMLLGNAQEALHTLQQLNESNPNKVELMMRLAQAYSETGDYTQSNAAYDSIATMFGNAIQVSSAKIDNYIAMGDSLGALQEMRSLLATAPENDYINIAMSGLFSHYNMSDSALYYLDRAQQYAPGNGYVYLARAEYYSSVGDSAAYEQQIYNALTAEQLDVDAKLTVLVSYIRDVLADNDTTQRVDHLFEVLIQQHPHEPKIHELYSEYFAAKDDYKRSIEQLGYSLDVNPTDADGWRNMMLLNMMDDNYPAAIQAADKALEYNPEDLTLYGYVGGCYQQMKEYEKAIGIYNQQLALLDSTDLEMRAEVITSMADAYSEMDSTSRAVECYETALELDPTNSGTLNNYAYYLAQRGENLDRAERMAAIAVQDNPENGNFIDTYAWVFFAKQDYKMALLYMKSAIEKDDSGNLLEHYGDVLFFNGETDQAVEQWTKALENDPDNELLQRKVKDKVYYEN